MRQRDEMRKALAVIQRGGGVLNARVFTKIWLALFGVYPWSGVPSLPPELVVLSVLDALQSLRFRVLGARNGRAADDRRFEAPGARARRGRQRDRCSGDEGASCTTFRGNRHWLMYVERLQKLYERLPVQPFREAACERVARWVVERQEADGSWGGIQPPWVYSLIALNIMGYSLDHPVMRKGLDGMRRFTIADPGDWRFQACMSPVWDTAWAVRVLALAGFSPSHPAMQRAVRWMLREQIPDDAPGDWRMKCKEVRGNGWAFEFDNDAYPDIDDTTIVVLALLEGGERDIVADSVERAHSLDA